MLETSVLSGILKYGLIQYNASNNKFKIRDPYADTGLQIALVESVFSVRFSLSVGPKSL
jgi:hypothetical protein